MLSRMISNGCCWNSKGWKVASGRTNKRGSLVLSNHVPRATLRSMRLPSSCTALVMFVFVAAHHNQFMASSTYTYSRGHLHSSFECLFVSGIYTPWDVDRRISHTARYHSTIDQKHCVCISHASDLSSCSKSSWQAASAGPQSIIPDQ